MDVDFSLRFPGKFQRFCLKEIVKSFAYDHLRKKLLRAKWFHSYHLLRQAAIHLITTICNTSQSKNSRTRRQTFSAIVSHFILRGFQSFVQVYLLGIKIRNFCVRNKRFLEKFYKIGLPFRCNDFSTTQTTFQDVGLVHIQF